MQEVVSSTLIGSNASSGGIFFFISSFSKKNSRYPPGCHTCCADLSGQSEGGCVSWEGLQTPLRTGFRATVEGGQDRSDRGTLTSLSPVQDTLLEVSKKTQVSVLKQPKAQVDKFIASGSKLKASKVNLAHMPVANR
jgi:hypothetical protein